MARKYQAGRWRAAIAVVLTLLVPASIARAQHPVTPPPMPDMPRDPVMPPDPIMPPDPVKPPTPAMPPNPEMPPDPVMPPNPTLTSKPEVPKSSPRPDSKPDGTANASKTPATTQPRVTPAPLSQDCQAGGEQIVEQSPLPNVATALQSRRQIRILAIGSSSSIGRRSSRPGGHGEQIRDILQRAIKGLDVVMINRGVSGELAEQAAARVRNEVALQEPDVVLWQVGTNDALAYVPLDDLRNTIVETIHWLRGHKVDVVLAGLQYVDRMAQDDHYRAVRELLRDIAQKENVMIVRRYEAQHLLAQAEHRGGGLGPDEFERSDVGYACLSQYMARAITLGIFGQALRVHPLSNPPSRPQDRPPGSGRN